MADSCSLTPPLSPFKNTAADVSYHKLQDLGEWVSPCFSCGETGTPFTVIGDYKSYLRSGELKNLLEGELGSLSSQISGLVNLYDMTFSSRTGVFTNLRQLFACTRKRYYLLKILSEDHVSGFTSYTNRSAAAIRKDMVKFLFILKNSLQRIHQAVTSKSFTSLSEPCQSDSHFCEPKHLQNILSEVWKELKTLLLFVRRISDLPEYICTKASGSSSNSSCYHRVHFCFDLWWSSLEIMHIIHSICSSLNVELNEEMCSYTSQGSRSIFSQTALLVLWDLCFISMKNYKGFSGGSRGLNPFLCSCVQELWVLLIILLDRRDEHYREGSFWYHFDFIRHTMANSQDSSASIKLSLNCFSLQNNQLICDRPEEFCLWIVSHVSPLYKYGVDGIQMDLSCLKSCYSTVRHLVESALSRQMKTRHEKHLRTVLAFCGLSVKLWEPTGDILLPLTDFFLRHIDDPFSLPGFEVRQLSYLFKTSSAWVEYIHKIVLLENYFTSAENSFYLYLHILGVQLKTSGCGGNLWRQLKGRIYSRLTTRRLKELSEVGLQNCFSILLVIASVGFFEVCTKIAELVAIIETPPTSKKKQAISWKTLFALMIFHQEKNGTLENEASKLVSFFNKACSSYNEVSGDSIKKVDLLNLIFVYLESVVSIFEKSMHLGLSEHLLLGSGFLSLLPACGVSELNSVLEIVLNLLTRFRNVKEYCQKHEIISYQLQHVMIWDSFCLNILPFTMNHTTVNAPFQLADIAVSFTILAFYFQENSLKSNSSYIELFRHFGTHRNSNSFLMCRYLCFILHESSLMETIKMHITDLHVLILQSWLKCGLSLSPPCIQMKELTRVMLHIEEFVMTFPYVKSLVSSDDHGYTMIKLFRAIDESYQNCLTLQEKTILKQKVHTYFQGLPAIVTCIIKDNASSTMLHHIYKVTGHLLEYCSPCLYIKYKSDCVFPVLLDTLILPHVTFPKDKELINNLSVPIKEYFPLFVRGLARLDSENDPYVQRKLKDIITYYVNQHYTFASAPLLEIASNAAFQKSETMNRNLFYFIVDVVRENFIAKHVPGSPQGVKYCIEIFKQVPSDMRLKLANNLFPCLLEQLLLRDDPGIPILKELLKVLLTVFQEESESHRNSSVQVLVPAVKKLIDKHLPWLTSRVFRWLEYVSEVLPFLMSEIIPFLSKSVESIEIKRGVGSDLVLRNGLRNLVNKCHQHN